MKSRYRALIAAALLASSASVIAAPNIVSAQVVVGSESDPVFINEIHYDNKSDDDDEREGVEVAGPAGTDLSGWKLVEYNGNGGKASTPLNLSGTIDNENSSGYGALWFDLAGLQNGVPDGRDGAPDGVALVDGSDTVVQFLSYEGTFEAVDGPAKGLTSTDIGVSEGGTLENHSLQLQGDGTTYDDFVWATEVPATRGDINAGQTFGIALPAVTINEARISSKNGSVTNFIELSGPAGTALDGLAVHALSGDDDAGTVEYSTDLDGKVIPPNGFFVLDAVGTRNAAQTLVLVQGDVITTGTDVDANGDGVVDDGNWTALIDSVALAASDTSVNYSSVVVGPNGNYVPAHIYRCKEGFRIGNYSNAQADTKGDANACATPTVPISQIQGSGPESPMKGQKVSTSGVIVGYFESNDAVNGFYIQSTAADVDDRADTSEGLYVYCGGVCASVPTGPAAQEIGDLVTVTGTVSEFYGTTQIALSTSDSVELVTDNAGLPTPATVNLPTTNTAETVLEHVESMIITVPQTLAVSEYFELARFGELRLSTKRFYQFTHNNSPSVAGYAGHLEELGRNTLVLADRNNDENDTICLEEDNSDDDVRVCEVANNEALPFLAPTYADRIRGGDTISGVTGIAEWDFGSWRMIAQPEAFSYTFTTTNPAPAAVPEVGGDITVASFNVLNYFTTLRTAGNTAPRGADSAVEFERQANKIVAALSAMNADVVGLIEIENDGGASVADLVDRLNTKPGAGHYAAVTTDGKIGSDAIAVGFIYQPATVTPVGDPVILDKSVDARFNSDKNRPVLIQTFQDGNGSRFTVAVNHLKSKGSDCDEIGDPDVKDGQGNCNLTRTAAANALADYLATDPTGSGDKDFLIIGDLNSYRTEDPIRALVAAGYTDLIKKFGGDEAYGYVFDGQLGYLDHALANATLTKQVTDAADWHINADEFPIFDYNDAVLDPAEQFFERETTSGDLYDAGPYRSSDHDPVIVGLDLVAPLVVDAGDALGGNEGQTVAVAGAATGGVAPLSYGWSAAATGPVDPGATCVFADPTAATTTVTCNDDGNFKLTLTVTDAKSTTAADTTMLTVTNVAPTVEFKQPSTDITVEIGENVDFLAAGGDAGSNDDLTCSIRVDDKALNSSLDKGNCVARTAFSATGEYEIVATFDDGDSSNDTTSRSLNGFRMAQAQSGTARATITVTVIKATTGNTSTTSTTTSQASPVVEQQSPVKTMPTPPNLPSGSLPKTGTGVSRFTGVALSLLLAGLALVVVTRRRKSTPVR